MAKKAGKGEEKPKAAGKAAGAEDKPAKAAEKPAKAKTGGGRQSWLDEADAPQIDKYARQLDTFIQTMADGRVDAKEVEAQEKRLAKLMKEIEPKLDDELHARVTELLCELTSYDIMQILHSLEGSRPKTTFRG